MAAAGAEIFKPLFGEMDVFKVFEVLEDRFARVVSLGATGTLGKPVEAFFDCSNSLFGSLRPSWQRGC